VTVCTDARATRANRDRRRCCGRRNPEVRYEFGHQRPVVQVREQVQGGAVAQRPGDLAYPFGARKLHRRTKALAAGFQPGIQSRLVLAHVNRGKRPVKVQVQGRPARIEPDKMGGEQHLRLRRTQRVNGALQLQSLADGGLLAMP
jgi:hypothetical protein